MEGEIDFDRLRVWMDGQGVGEGPIESVTPLTGGTQNVLVRFRRGSQSYVLRRPPWQPRPTSNETMRREARVLAALAGTEVPHARLLAHADADGPLGVAFYLMEAVEGFNPTEGLPPLHAGSPELRRGMGLSMVEAIASLGALDHEALELTGFGKPDNYLQRQVARWTSQLASYREHVEWPGAGGLPDVERVAHWLEAHRPAGGRPGILHGDFQLSNVMFRHDSADLAAIIDWELATIGDPLVDLGALLAGWPNSASRDPLGLTVTPWTGFPSAGELVSRYAACSDRDMTAIDWYEVLACFKLGIILEGTFARACAGQAPREVGARLHAFAVGLFERAHRRIA